MSVAQAAQRLNMSVGTLASWNTQARKTNLPQSPELLSVTELTAQLRIAIRSADTKTRSTYGAKRLQDELAEGGIIAGRDRIARLRREAGIRCI